MRGAAVMAVLSVVATAAGAQERLTPEEFIRAAAEDNLADREFGRMVRSDPTLPPGVHQVGRELARGADEINAALARAAADNQVRVSSDLGEQDRQMIQRLSRIEGEEFTREYLQFVINDLERDIQFYQDAVATQPADLRRLAERALPVLEANLAVAQRVWDEQVAEQTGAEAEEGGPP